ncbi:MAG TPA: hypothetical protein VF624_18355 [Tepidisphaeraceae bacterium]|jgi:DNA-binding CsgD family transcriptional regulator
MYQLLEPDAAEKRNFSSLERVGARQRKAWQWLGETDRLIVELASQGNSQRLISRAVGITPGTVSRRLNAIQQRLGDAVTLVLLDPSTPLDDDTRSMALLHQVGRLSAPVLARQLGIAQSVVRERLRYARGIARGRLMRRAAGG